jgi:uncharacterized OB-fold protein
MAMVVAREWREIPGKYNLEGTKCGCCGKIFFPARTFCPYCRRSSAGKMEAHRLSGKGEVFSFSIVHDNSGFNDRMMPYAVVMVKDDDGVMIEGQLVDVDFDTLGGGLAAQARDEAVASRLSHAGDAVDVTGGHGHDGFHDIGGDGHSANVQIGHNKSPIWVSMKSVVASPAQNTSLSSTLRWKGSVVLMPSMTNSSRARRPRASASSRDCP